MNCPPATAIADLVDGRLARLALCDIEGHLDRCRRCADLVAVAVSSRASVTPNIAWERPVLEPGTQLGRYVLRRWIGRGGMGDVYEGFDPKLERKVAIKLLRDRGDDSRVAQRRLEREARTLARLSHPHVVAALDIGVFEDQVFLVMELAEGPSLAGWLKVEQRSWRQILGVFLEAGEGLAAAHDVGVIHRDFKPQNVLMGADGKARVSDFGLASSKEIVPLDEAGAPSDRGAASLAEEPAGGWVALLAKETLTETVGAVGTPRYMAPEQLLRQPLDARCDQFSFCVALHEALSGEHPFAPAGVTAERGPTDSLQSAPGLRSFEGQPRKIRSRALSAALKRGLARNPADRYPSMRELLAPLRQVLVPRRSANRLFLTAALAVSGVVAAATIIWDYARPRTAVPAATGASGPAAIRLTGTAADWTDSSRILATVDGYLRCLVALPDHRTLRFVVGSIPPRAEDMDLTTGVRHPSPLVPAAYAEGCPDLSPDGKSLIFQGYDGDGRAAVFLSTHPDGREARAVVPAAHPSMQSEPKWFAGGKAFVFDVDDRHVGVFNALAETTRIVPTVMAAADWSLIKVVAGDRIFTVRIEDGHHVHLEAFSWPDLVSTEQLRLWDECVDRWQTADGRTFFCTSGSDLAQVDLTRQQARRVANVRGQFFVFSAVVPGGLAFATQQQSSDAWMRTPGAAAQRLTNDGNIREVASCGSRGLLVTRGVGHEPWRILRIAPDGTISDAVAERWALSPVCSRTTDDWWFAGMREVSHIEHCHGDVCATIAEAPVQTIALSPDEKRLAFLSVSERGMFVRWIAADGGGPVHGLAETETFCVPGWSSNNTLWVSRRQKGKPVWIEMNVDSGQDTGRTKPGGKTCIFDPAPDPLAPVHLQPEIVTKTTSQVRFMPLPADK